MPPRLTLPHPPALRRWLLPLVVAAALLLAACGAEEEAPPPAEPVASGGVIDSTHSIEEEIRRFRLTVDSVPAALRHGATSRDALVRRFLRAVETRDSLELPRLVLQPDEFIGLYYPHTPFTAPPYELSPSLLWFQMQNRSSRGITRLLQRDGGHPIPYEGTRCPAPARVEGPNLIWDGCVVMTRDAGGLARERRLFGAIMERSGTFKFLSYSNEY